MSIAKDLGIHLQLEIQTDASAAVGIRRRRGVGKIRHLATADLWVQDKIRCGSFTLTKIPGIDNPSDILTKFVQRPVLSKHLSALGLRMEEGRPESAPTISHQVSQLQHGTDQIASL